MSLDPDSTPLFWLVSARHLISIPVAYHKHQPGFKGSVWNGAFGYAWSRSDCGGGIYGTTHSLSGTWCWND